MPRPRLRLLRDKRAALLTSFDTQETREKNEPDLFHHMNVGPVLSASLTHGFDPNSIGLLACVYGA